MNYSEIVDKVNNGFKMQDEADKLGISKRTLQRRLKAEGFIYDSETKKYIKEVNGEDIKDILIVSENSGKNTTMSSANRSFTVQDDIHRALKLKAVLEETDMSKIVNDALKQFIESKYFDLRV